MNKVELSPVEAARFQRKIKVDDNGCWLWTGCLNSKGYACLGVRKQAWLGHRLSYSVSVGAIPDGMVIDHLCRVRRCVNPAHLEAVTSAENNHRSLRDRGIPFLPRATPKVRTAADIEFHDTLMKALDDLLFGAAS